MFILLLILIVAGVYCWRRTHNSGCCHHSYHHNHHHNHQPLDVLAERYARGEIEQEEYQARKRELTR